MPQNIDNLILYGRLGLLGQAYRSNNDFLFPVLYYTKKEEGKAESYVVKQFRVHVKEPKFICAKLEPANIPDKDTKFSVTANFPEPYSKDEFTF